MTTAARSLPETLADKLHQTLSQLITAETACRRAYEERDALLEELLAAGYSQRQAGALLGISGPRVARITNRR